MKTPYDKAVEVIEKEGELKQDQRSTAEQLQDLYNIAIKLKNVRCG